MVNTNKKLDFDGVSTASCECYISGSGTFRTTAREYETFQVPGRNGDLHVDTKRYSNVEIVYPAFIVKDFKANYDRLTGFLLSKIGYKALYDDYHPDIYRMARFVGSVDPEMGTLNRSGRFELVFDAKPQKFLLSGLEEVEYTASGEIVNNEVTEAIPLLRVYGAGKVTIGGCALTINAHGKAYADIDCELMDAYYGTANLNQYVIPDNGTFPVLKPGSNAISLGSGITKVTIIPRWWRL